jgi:hypothetical protein
LDLGYLEEGMRQLFGLLLVVVVLAGCGAGEGAVAVTPVVADTRGTYRLVASSVSAAAPGGAVTFSSYSGGTLRLDDPSYTRAVLSHGEQFSKGAYRLGTSVNSILNSRNGTFSLTSTDPPFLFSGSYHVTPDFTLSLEYDPFVLPDAVVVTRSEIWIKQSDSPRFGL